MTKYSAYANTADAVVIDEEMNIVHEEIFECDGVSPLDYYSRC